MRFDGSEQDGRHHCVLHYDNYVALLHEGERVLTAREVREEDRGGGAGRPITISIGGTWSVRSDADVDAIAEAIYRRIELAERGGVRA